MKENIIEEFFIAQQAHKWFELKCYVHAEWMLEKVSILEVYIFSDHRLYMFWSYLSLGLLFGNLGSRYVSNYCYLDSQISKI